MLRILIAALMIYALVMLLRSVARRVRPPRRPGEIGKPGEMVVCARCGTFVLEALAIENGGHWYCCESCRRGG